MAPRVLRALRDDGWQVRAWQSRSIEDLEERVGSLHTGDVVAVMGGDGTLGRAAAGAFHSGAVLAPLPGGRGNDFCRVLGVSRDAVTAARQLRTAKVRRIDLGVAGARVFVCVAHAGIDSVANEIANHTPVLSGTPLYLYAAVRALASWTPMTFQISSDSGEREQVGWSVMVGKGGQYGGGMRIAPHASVDDGRLAVTYVGDVSRSEFFRVLPRVFNGTHVQHPKVSTESTTAITISADREAQVYADGEFVGLLPMTFQVLPGALQVLTPRT